MSLEPKGSDIDVEEAETLAKWRGLKTSDLTDGIMETRMPNAEGVPTVVKYDVPLARPNVGFYFYFFFRPFKTYLWPRHFAGTTTARSLHA